MLIRTRDDLKTYVMRRLGHPVIRINVEENQLQDRIDDALCYFQLFSSDSQITHFVKHIITQQEIDAKKISLDDSVISITRVFPTDSPFYPNWMSPEYQNFIRELKDLQSGSLESFYITERHISLLNFMLAKTDFRFFFHESAKSLEFSANWGSFIPGKSFIIFEQTEKLDPNDHPSLWDSYWLKELAYYYVLRQWASNLKKYANVPLPGGITLNAQEMLDEATTNIATIQEFLKSASDPLPFFECA